MPLRVEVEVELGSEQRCDFMRVDHAGCLQRGVDFDGDVPVSSMVQSEPRSYARSVEAGGEARRVRQSHRTRIMEARSLGARSAHGSAAVYIAFDLNSSVYLDVPRDYQKFLAQNYQPRANPHGPVMHWALGLASNVPSI